MAQEDDLRALGKIMDFLRAVSIILAIMNVYWFCYEAMHIWGVTIGVVDRILINFNRTGGLFHSILYTKLFSLLLLALSCLGTKGVKAEKMSWNKIWTVLVVGSCLFFLNWWILLLPISNLGNATLYIFTMTAGYICLLMGGLWMSRLLKHNLMEDVFNNENESFMQETKLMENEYSVNLPTRFFLKKKWQKMAEDGSTWSNSLLYDELANYLSPFMDAWEGGAQDQLQGQIASAKIPLSRMISPALYWVMTGDDFSLDINNPKEPKVLVVGNNPDRQNIYSAALGLYNSRIVKLINKKKQLKSSVIIDELPTIYFRGLDNLIATARSNKVAVCLGFQDFSQLTRDYGDKESKVIQNTVGNVFSGQVVGETAKTLSERFGKVLQQRQSMTINRNDKSTSISTQMDSLIPASKISNLTQGIFVGAVSDNFDERIDQKIFHAEIVVDSVKVSAEMKAYQPIPVIVEFKNEDGSDNLKETIEANYRKVKQEILTLVDSEIQRIKNTPALSHLIPDK